MKHEEEGFCCHLSRLHPICLIPVNTLRMFSCKWWSIGVTSRGSGGWLAHGGVDLTFFVLLLLG